VVGRGLVRCRGRSQTLASDLQVDARAVGVAYARAHCAGACRGCWQSLDDPVGAVAIVFYAEAHISLPSPRVLRLLLLTFAHFVRRWTPTLKVLKVSCWPFVWVSHDSNRKRATPSARDVTSRPPTRFYTKTPPLPRPRFATPFRLLSWSISPSPSCYSDAILCEWLSHSGSSSITRRYCFPLYVGTRADH
jgi:hypothetical protein